MSMHRRTGVFSKGGQTFQIARLAFNGTKMPDKIKYFSFEMINYKVLMLTWAVLPSFTIR